MTPEEKRQYTRGYNRGLARQQNRANRAIEIAKAYRARTGDRETERLCVNCDRWTRGGPNCVWGTCRADFEYGLEGRVWAEALVGDRDVQRSVITSEDFGCVSWIPRTGEMPR